PHTTDIAATGNPQSNGGVPYPAVAGNPANLDARRVWLGDNLEPPGSCAGKTKHSILYTTGTTGVGLTFRFALEAPNNPVRNPHDLPIAPQGCLQDAYQASPDARVGLQLNPERAGGVIGRQDGPRWIHDPLQAVPCRHRRQLLAECPSHPVSAPFDGEQNPPLAHSRQVRPVAAHDQPVQCEVREADRKSTRLN